MLRFHAAFFVPDQTARTTADSAPAVDVAVGAKALSVSVTETASAADAVTRTTSRTRTTTDAAATTDTATGAKRLAVTAVDSAATTDTATAVDSTPPKPTIYSRLTTLDAAGEWTKHPNLGGVGIMVKWADWETLDNDWSEPFEAQLRAALAEAKTRGKSLVVRPLAGSDSPGWIYTNATRPVRRTTTMTPETFPPLAVPTPIADDPNYLFFYNRMIQRLNSILEEPIPGGTQKGSKYVRAVALAGPTAQGSEMTIAYAKRVETVNGTTRTVATAGQRGSTTLTLNSDPGAAWPTSTPFLVRVGASWTSEVGAGNLASYSFPKVRDTFLNRTTSAGDVGRTRHEDAYFITAQNAGNINQLSVTGNAMVAALPAGAGTGIVDFAILNGAQPVQDGDHEIRFSASALPTTATTAQSWSIALLARATTGTPQHTHYGVMLTRSTNGTTRLAINRRTNSSTNAANLGPAGNASITSNGTGIGANEVWIIRARFTTVGSDVAIKAKAWRESDGEPAAWTHDFTDAAPGAAFTGSGAPGVRFQSDSDNTSAVTFTLSHLVAGPTTTAPFLLRVTRSGATLTVVDKDWSGTFGQDTTAGMNVHYVDSPDVATTEMDGVSGPRSEAAYNFGEWELAVPGETNRQTRWRDAWKQNMLDHAATFHPSVKLLLAAGSIFLDDWVGVTELVKWGGNGSSTVITSPDGSFGTRLQVTTTNLLDSTDWTSTTDNVVLLHKTARTAGCSMKGHTAALARLADGDPLIRTLERYRNEFGPNIDFETSHNRFDSTTLNTASTATFLGWSGGSGRTPKQYLVDDGGSLQNRLGTSRTTTDSAPAVDTVGRVRAASRVTTDSATVTDTASGVRGVARTTTDAATTTDTATRTRTSARTAVDAAGVTDTAMTGTAGGTRSTTDTATVADTAARATTRARTVTDTASTTDTATRATTRARTATDTATAADTAASTPAGGRATTDTASAADTAGRTASFARAATDSASTTDTATRTTARTQSTVDSAAVNDTATQVRATARTTTDTAGATDTAGRAVVWVRATADTASAVDAASAGRRVARVTVDTATVVDTATATITTVTESNVSAWVKTPVAVGPVGTQPVPVGVTAVSRPVPVLTR